MISNAIPLFFCKTPQSLSGIVLQVSFCKKHLLCWTYREESIGAAFYFIVVITYIKHNKNLFYSKYPVYSNMFDLIFSLLQGV